MEFTENEKILLRDLHNKGGNLVYDEDLCNETCFFINGHGQIKYDLKTGFSLINKQLLIQNGNSSYKLGMIGTQQAQKFANFNI